MSHPSIGPIPILALAVVFMTSLPDSVSSGTYMFSSAAPDSTDRVVHPPGYDGTGGVLSLKVCVSNLIDDDYDVLKPAINHAIQIWNELEPRAANCPSCSLWEQDVETVAVSLSDILVHEFGHCIMGLDHPNWSSGGPGPRDPSSFTDANGATVMTVGTDGVRGTVDDEVFPMPGAEIIHWFRKADNDPFVIDDTIIDKRTYSREMADLQTLGHSWVANANLASGAAMGYGGTQSVMYSLQESQYLGLSADDVNMVQFAMTGADEMAGTLDDYTVHIEFSDVDCSTADVEVFFVDPDPASEMVVAQCLAGLKGDTGATGLPEGHDVLVPFSGRQRMETEINAAWTFGNSPVFRDGFENGVSGVWDLVVGGSP